MAMVFLSVTEGYVAPPQRATIPRVAPLRVSTLTRLDVAPAPERSIDRYDTTPEMDIRHLEASLSPGSHVIDLARGPPIADPFAMVADELTPFSDNIRELVATENPVLSTAASHFFEKRHGKRFRPTIVALLARALPAKETGARPKQRRLGQVTEMIHVASLIHDDVLDDADTRRGGDAIHKMYSNKVAVLAGDYLLARASVELALLGNVGVVEVMASALDSLVSGEIMQIKSNGAAAKKVGDGDELSKKAPASLYERAKQALALSRPSSGDAASAAARDARDARDMELYLRKSYYKTASLISDASRSCALLGGHEDGADVASAAEEYGYHLGLAFQIIDDVLDVTVDSADLGKPAGADLSLGLATAPILYAAQDREELRPLIDRRFKGDGDVAAALAAVKASRGIELARKLAQFHAQRAVDAICRVAPDGEARDALISVAYVVLSREK